MKLKCLEIKCWTLRAEDHIEDPSLNLIRVYASEITHLKTQSLLLLKFLLSSAENLNFPNLEGINIASLSTYDNTVQKDILRSLQPKSPKLMTIFVDHSISFDVLPAECYGLVGSLEFGTDDIFAEGSLLPQIVDKNPKIRRLKIYDPVGDDNETLQPMLELVKKLFRSCQDSLEDLTLCCAHGLH